jgi:hypothetical protein
MAWLLRIRQLANPRTKETMRTLVRFTALVVCAAGSHPLAAQETAGALEARVWVDRGDEPVLHRGEDVRVYYRTSQDAFAAIFRIDTDGRVHLVYPQHPDAIEVVRGGRDFRLLFPRAPVWRVNEDPGVGYFFIVASPEPLDFSTFPFDELHGWDVSGVGEVVYSDPYVAIDDYVARIVPDWEVVPYALDFLTYSVGQTYSYPRFLCYDCHSYQRYATWNPYDYTCSTFRVVIWDDPYFYPRYRYSGVDVVVAPRPVRASLPRYEVTRRAVGDAVAPVVRVRAPVERRVVQYRDPEAAAAPTLSGPGRRSASAVALPQERPRATPQQVPDTARSRPTLQRRPSSRLPVRTPPAPRPEPEPTPTRAAPSRLPARTPAARPSDAPAEPQRAPAAAPRPDTREPAAAPAPSRSSTVRPTAPSSRAAPSQPRAAPRSSPTQPSRPSVRGVPAPRSAPSAGPSRPGAAPRPQVAPRSGGGTGRPSASPAPSASGGRPSSSPPARASAPPRASEPRPTVRPRAEPR